LFSNFIKENYYNPSWQNLLGLGKTNSEIMTHSLSKGFSFGAYLLNLPTFYGEFSPQKKKIIYK
jgi:nucleoside-diphosphate-sugar epimerase